MKFFVSRQINWPDGDHLVEICAGGLNFANPGMLTCMYKGEGIEYLDPREALAVAKKIQELWQKDDPEEDIGIAAGTTLGFSMPFSPMSDDALDNWAQKQYDKLSKCDCCGDILPSKYYYHQDQHDVKFCSEYCLDKTLEAESEENEHVDA